MEQINLEKFFENFRLNNFKNELFKDKNKLGSGGFGVVYRSNYKSLKVAIKDAHDQTKFSQIVKEIRNMMGIRHVNIPKLYGLSRGNDSEGISLIFELIEGQTLNQYMKRKPSQIEIISHLIDLSSIIEVIHSNGIIHRDLKPDNIMIDLRTMSVKLLDFGISRKTYNEETKTIVIGTPLYMAPENFDIVFGTGQSKCQETVMKISQKVDIWALGLILSQLVSGEDPWSKYRGENIPVLFMKGVHYPIPEIKNNDIRELIYNCTEISPHKRRNIQQVKMKLYKILYDLVRKQQDINIELNFGEFSQAKNQKLSFMLSKKIRNQLLEYYNLLKIEKENMKSLEIENIKTITKYMKENNQLLYIKEFDKNALIMTSKDKSMIIWDLKSGKLKKEFKKHSGEINCMTHTRDLGNSKNYIALGCEDKNIYIWNLEGPTDTPSFVLIGHTAPVTCLQYLREFQKDTLASGSKDNTIKIWNVTQNKCLATLSNHMGPILQLFYFSNYSFPNSKNILLSTSSDKTIKTWNLMKRTIDKSFSSFNPQSGSIKCIVEILKFNEKKDIFATGSNDGSIKIWEYQKENCILNINAHNGEIIKMVSLKEYDINMIATSGTDNLIKIWDISREIPYIRCLEGHTSEINCLVYFKNFNSEVLASGSFDFSIKIWNFVEGQMLYSINQHQDKIISLIYLEGNDEQMFVSGALDNCIKLWKIQ